MIGIYLIKNKINNKLYVGSTTVSFNKRWSYHRYDLRKNIHANKHLQKSWNKYGEINFEFILLEECSKEICTEREQYYINTLLPEYNILKFANRVTGYKHTDETKQLISKIHKNKILSKETKEKMSKSRKGIVPSKKTLDAAIKINLGCKRSIECRQKMSIKAKNRKPNHIKKIKDSNDNIYESIADASRKLGIKRTTINEIVLKHVKKPKCGLFFDYVNEEI